jgi:hypothetical protein
VRFANEGVNLRLDRARVNAVGIVADGKNRDFSDRE